LTARIWPRSSSVAALQPGARAAGVAGDRLGVEAPVAGIFIFGAARRAHREGRHGGARAVVGRFAYDRKARAAIGAIGERIAETACKRIANLLEARRACRGVGRNLGAHRAACAHRDAERFADIAHKNLAQLDPVDPRQRRAFGADAIDEAPGLVGVAVDANQHALGVVQHFA